VVTHRIVVFRLDRNPLVCRTRIRTLRRLNPGVPIVGLYGGPGGFRRASFRLGSRAVLGLDSFYASRRPGHWNWQHGDLAVAAWYRDVGHRLDFDVAHLVEWDLLLLAPLDELYRDVAPDAVGLTAYTPLSEVGEEWDWLRRPERRTSTHELFRYAREHWGHAGEPYACVGVGPCFPRAFLAEYAALDAPELGHDELRLPLFAAILGYRVVDTGFRHSWHGDHDDAFFNASGQAIQEAAIVAELRRPEGRRAFHPVREIVAGWNGDRS
jgi:hypothetical protein